MLSDRGELTEIGMWYLGRSGQGAKPMQGRGVRVGVGVWPCGMVAMVLVAVGVGWL